MNKRDDELLYFNGVNGATGRYGLPPMTGTELEQRLHGSGKADNWRELKRRYETREHFGAKAGVDATDLSQAGWGVVFPSGADPAVREALEPLLELRREQAGDLFKVYEGGKGYRPGDSKDKFLRRAGAGGSGPVDPTEAPYYLLLVGDPGTIPYRFQNLLGVPHAVGRIAFDTPQEYANYAASVVAAERGEAARAPEMAFFGVANRDDRATRMSVDHLVRPLHEKLAGKAVGWRTRALLEDEATKEGLAGLLGGEHTPALVFSASHGMEFPCGDTRQLPHQGALLCQDWPGPKQWRQAIPQDFYFAGDDLARDASLLGLIHFSFACYGGGTPRLDEYAKQAFQEHRETIAPHPFLADLPKRMLSLPRGGALAVVAHVDRAWSCSFMAPGLGSHTTAFESTFQQLLEGSPIGAAMEFFSDRYAEISTELNTLLEDLEYPDIEVDPWDVADRWTANNDARGYLVLGDPAVRLAVAAQDEAVREQPVIEVRPFVPSATAAAPPPEAFSAADLEEAEALSIVVVSTWASAERSGEPAIRTRLSLDGESEVFVSPSAEVDEGLRAIHEKAVDQALRARLAWLELRDPEDGTAG